jgi:hypothetical protein
LTILKRFFSYWHGIASYGLYYQGRLGLGKVLDIDGFVDAYWARDMDHRISTSGYVLTFLEDQSIG